MQSIGTIDLKNDLVLNKNHKWTPRNSTKLNGYKLFTVDYAAKYINKPLTLYCREYTEMWPQKNEWKKTSNNIFIFIPTGNAIKEKTIIPMWLKTQKPIIKKGSHFYIDGPLFYNKKNIIDNYIGNGMMVDSKNRQSISINLMNTEVYVKI